MGAVKHVWFQMVEDCREAANEIHENETPDEFIIAKLARVIQNLSYMSDDCHTVVADDIYDMATDGYRNICFGEDCEDCEVVNCIMDARG